MYIDTHVHYDHPRFDQNRAELLDEARKAGIEAAINAAVLPESNLSMRHKLQEYPWVWYAAGVHPAHVRQTGDARALMRRLRALAKDARTVAIGETGIDLHHDPDSLERQKSWFRRQIELAREFRLPLILHVRDAHEEVLGVLREYSWGAGPNGVVHGFRGERGTALAYLELGFCLGIGGSVTYSWDKELRELVAELPLAQILLESDSPHMVPCSEKAPFNTSQLGVLKTAQAIAELKGIDVREAARITTETARRVFPRMNPETVGLSGAALEGTAEEVPGTFGLSGIVPGRTTVEAPETVGLSGTAPEETAPDDAIRCAFTQKTSFLRTDWARGAECFRGFVRHGVLHVPQETGLRMDKEMYMIARPDGLCLMREKDFQRLQTLFRLIDERKIVKNEMFLRFSRYLLACAAAVTTGSVRTCRIPVSGLTRAGLQEDGEVEILYQPHDFSDVLFCVRRVLED